MLFCFVTEEILSITAVSEDRGSYAKPHVTGFPKLLGRRYCLTRGRVMCSYMVELIKVS